MLGPGVALYVARRLTRPRRGEDWGLYRISADGVAHREELLATGSRRDCCRLAVLLNAREALDEPLAG
jgi:hypothetical protein